ncbi:MAG: 4Fe-4S binding protein [Candidatus Diapherotrites archaeon]|nr:4Fe-4S binding protein [Candidatus Diapherotrites archaeon]
MVVKIDRKKCMYCGACVSVCPRVALNLKETWVDVNEKCIDCGICVKLCPVGAISLKERKK